MDEEAGFIAALDANPEDWVTRLVYADWLEERGGVRARGYRALAAQRRVPFLPADKEYCPWFCSPNAFVILMSDECVLPQDWFDLIDLPGKHNNLAPDHDCRRDATRSEVEDAAARAFALLPAPRQAELLAAPVPTPTPTEATT